MREADFYRSHVRPGLTRQGVHLSRVENSVEQGTPDVSYAVGGRQGWVELKVQKPDGLLYFEKFQLNWHKARWEAAGGRGLWVMALMLRNVVKAWPSSHLFNAPRKPHGKWLTVDPADVEPYMYLILSRPFDWAAVARHLRDGPLGE